jgi:hypothetical protein
MALLLSAMSEPRRPKEADLMAVQVKGFRPNGRPILRLGLEPGRRVRYELHLPYPSGVLPPGAGVAVVVECNEALGFPLLLPLLEGKTCFKDLRSTTPREDYCPEEPLRSGQGHAGPPRCDPWSEQRRRVTNGLGILEFNKAMITDNRLTAPATHPNDQWVSFYWSMHAAWVQWTADGRAGVFPRLQHSDSEEAHGRLDAEERDWDTIGGELRFGSWDADEVLLTAPAVVPGAKAEGSTFAGLDPPVFETRKSSRRLRTQLLVGGAGLAFGVAGSAIASAILQFGSVRTRRPDDSHERLAVHSDPPPRSLLRVAGVAAFIAVVLVATRRRRERQA